MNIDYFNGKSDSDKKIIHLYVIEKCTHHCKYCCNNLYSNLDIPTVTVNELKEANKILLTGGEPFLYYHIDSFAKSIKDQYKNIKQICVYTCGDSLYKYLDFGYTLTNIDGVNISPKNRYDAECVNKMFITDRYINQLMSLWSNRIYLFPNVRNIVDINKILKYESFSIINREWQKDFVPVSGIFRRLPILFEV